jgi:hypothetical protein
MTYNEIGTIIDKMKLQTGADHSEIPLLEYGERIFGRLLDESRRDGSSPERTS